jgi:hypothetical protein
MTQTAQAPALALLDAVTGGCVATVGFATRAVNRSTALTPTGVREAAHLGAHVAARLAGGLPGHLRAQGESTRRQVVELAMRRWHEAVPAALDLVLDHVDLTELVRRRVDLDGLAAGLDVDAVADRLDVDRVLDRVDITELVERRVDLDRLAVGIDVDAVADRLDVDRAARRIDVDAVAVRVDLDAIIDRLRLIALAEYVVDGIDLPRIIRESTGSFASEGLREVRTRSMEADQALAQFMDRVLLRRRSGRRHEANVPIGQNGAGGSPPAGMAPARPADGVRGD